MKNYYGEIFKVKNFQLGLHEFYLMYKAGLFKQNKILLCF